MIIQVIEDDLVTLSLLTSSIKLKGYQVYRDYNGKLFYKYLLNEIKPDLFLIDINLHDKDGVSLCRIAKAKDPNIPVYLISAYEGLEEKAKLSGADGFFEKPIDMTKLFETIRQHELVER